MTGKTKMNKIIATAIALAFFAAAPADAQNMEITPNGSRPSAKAPAEYFAGSVVLTPLFGANAPMRSTAGHVTFEPGARSAWHTHPVGQILIVMSGVGWVQEWNGDKREIRPGDVIWTPPGLKHWHGATVTNEMSHVAIQELVDGRNVDWMEDVSDEQYRK